MYILIAWSLYAVRYLSIVVNKLTFTCALYIYTYIYVASGLFMKKLKKNYQPKLLIDIIIYSAILLVFHWFLSQSMNYIIVNHNFVWCYWVLIFHSLISYVQNYNRPKRYTKRVIFIIYNLSSRLLINNSYKGRSVLLIFKYLLFKEKKFLSFGE